MGESIDLLVQQSASLAQHVFLENINKENEDLTNAKTDRDLNKASGGNAIFRDLQDVERNILFSTPVELQCMKQIKQHSQTQNQKGVSMSLTERVEQTKQLLHTFDILSGLYDHEASMRTEDLSDFQNLKNECQRLRARHAGLVAGVTHVTKTTRVADAESTNMNKARAEQMEQEKLKNLEQAILKINQEISKIEGEVVFEDDKRFSTSESELLEEIQQVQQDITDLRSVEVGRAETKDDEDLAAHFDNDPEVKELLEELTIYKQKCKDFEEQARLFENEKKDVLVSEDNNNKQEMCDLAEEIERQLPDLVELEGKVKEMQNEAESISKRISSTIDECLKTTSNDTQAWAMATALKVLQEEGGKMKLSNFKEQLKVAYDGDSGRVLQTVYSLSGYKLINIDRKTLENTVTFI